MDSITSRHQLTPLEEADIIYSSRCTNHTRPNLRFPPPPAYPPPGGQSRLEEDLDRIEICIEEPKSSKSSSKRQTPSPQVYWRRDNIAATMERFEPTDYSYAYYEPGPATRHNNVPIPGSIAGPSTSDLTSSLKPKKNRHTYITRYGTQENIYEEIGDVAARAHHMRRAAGLQQSMISLNQSIVEEEFRIVQTRHRRVLGELNLSVEAMLMPEAHESPDDSSETGDNLADLLAVGPTDELLSPAACNQMADLDSGFSGSSSGASYVGSLRYRSHFPRASTPMEQTLTDQGVYGSQRSDKQDSGKTESKGFWKKGWRKLPGFSSTTSVNKAGLIDNDSYAAEYVHNLIKTGNIVIDAPIRTISRFLDEGEIVIYREVTDELPCTVQTPGLSAWSDKETAILLDRYELYSKQVGPLKKLKNKKSMWERISNDIFETLNIRKTALQVENRYKTVIKRKKDAIDNNNKSGSSRMDIPFEDELNKIAALDDSVQPEVLRSARNVQILKRPSYDETPKHRKKNNSIQDTLMKIHEQREETRERRHKEKLNLIRELFGEQTHPS